MSEPKAAKLKRLARLKAKAKARVKGDRAQRIWDAIKRALPNNEEEDHE